MNTWKRVVHNLELKFTTAHFLQMRKKHDAHKALERKTTVRRRRRQPKVIFLHFIKPINVLLQRSRRTEEKCNKMHKFKGTSSPRVRAKKIKLLLQLFPGIRRGLTSQPLHMRFHTPVVFLSKIITTRRSEFIASLHMSICEEAGVSGPVAAACAPLAGPLPLMITLVLLSSESSSCPSEFSSWASSDSHSLLPSLSHSDSAGSLGSPLPGSHALLSGCSPFSLSFWAWASLECLHFMRLFWNHTFTWRDTHANTAYCTCSVCYSAAAFVHSPFI